MAFDGKRHRAHPSTSPSRYISVRPLYIRSGRSGRSTSVPRGACVATRFFFPHVALGSLLLVGYLDVGSAVVVLDEAGDRLAPFAWFRFVLVCGETRWPPVYPMTWRAITTMRQSHSRRTPSPNSHLNPALLSVKYEATTIEPCPLAPVFVPKLTTFLNPPD
jgi:hypothetical protein